MAEQTTQLAEVEFLLKKLENARIPEGLRESIDLRLKRLRRIARQGILAGEYESTAKYIDWCLRVPWNRYNRDNLDLATARQIMDSLHYSHGEIKDSVTEFLSILKRKSEKQDLSYTAPILAFVGVQGAGKTSLARAIAKSLGRPFFRISLGAIGSSTELRGSYNDAASGEPGQIVKALVRAGCMNPVILLDEFDKVSGQQSLRTDFMSIMLEILDPEQNTKFRDHYIDYPVDLSQILFIATANRFTTISRELLDRMEIIQFNDYSMEEKLYIAKYYLFPKCLKYAGLEANEFRIADEAWPTLVQTFGDDQGVRRLENNLKRVARNVLKQIVTNQTTSITIDSSNVNNYLRLALPDIDEILNIDYTKISNG